MLMEATDQESKKFNMCHLNSQHNLKNRQK